MMPEAPAERHDTLLLTPTARDFAAASRDWREALDASGAVGLWDIDLVTGLMQADLGLRRLCGLSSGGSTAGLTLAEYHRLVHPQDQTAFADALDQAGDGQSFVCVHRILPAPGGTRWLEARGRGVRSADGLLTRVVGASVEITDHRLAAEAAREAALRHTLAQSIAGIGTFETFVETDDFIASDQFYRLFGLAPKARSAVREVTDLVLPEDRSQASTLATRRAGRPLQVVQYRIRRPDTGEVRWIERRADYIPAEAGAPPRLLGAARDVTDQKRTEAQQAALVLLGDQFRDRRAAADIEEMSRVVGKTLGHALLGQRAGYGRVDAAARTVLIEGDWCASDAVASIAGLHHFDDYGTYIEELLHGETIAIADVSEDPRTLPGAAALHGLAINSLLNVPLLEHGQLVAVLFVHDSVRAWNADEIAFVRAVGDRAWSAMEQARAEAQLRQLNETLEAQVAERTRERDRAWKNSLDLQLVIDQTGTIRAANEAWRTMLGWDPAEVVGHSYLDFVPEADQRRALEAFDKAISAALPTLEGLNRHKDGSTRWIAWVASAEAGLIYASGRNISAEKAAAAALEATQEQLRQSQKMEAVGQLTGGLAHDFNNLLTGISGGLELLQNRISQGRWGELERYVVAAQGACKRASALTHRLLAFSRRQTLEPKPTDVNRLVVEMEDLIRRSAGPSVELKVICAAGLWTTLIDPSELENALLNLCINGRDAMAGRGTLTVETGNATLNEPTARACGLPPGDYVALQVSDTGSVMTPEVISRAFDPFFTTKPSGQGTGLGLSMIYGFARQSGGQIRITSELGRGTTMSLYLPRHRGAVTAEAASGPEVAPRAERGQTVLVVDDEPTVRMMVTEVLEDLDYIAIEAGDGASALPVLQSAARLDLLITDIGLPGELNGRQVAEAGRGFRPGLKVLFITGYAENAVVGNGPLSPGMEILTKPFSADVLARRIKALIATR